ncbi:MAG TPA: choice-of-anchor N protein [Thermoguttaceae bacterium]|nr:choice-of-anchor N protein [Thermoguttaceae bacterium]
MRRVAAVAILGLLLLAGGRGLYAAPVLQLYLEGGVYDQATNSWVMAPPGSSSGKPFRLWAVGNVSGPGANGAIENVRLAIAYRQEDLGLAISFKPAQVGGQGLGWFHGFVDPSLPAVPVRNTTVRTSLGVVTIGPEGVVTDGATPVLEDGTPLPADGLFGPGTVWEEFSLGDFRLNDSPVGDFSGPFPTELALGAGQINVYEVSVLGGTGATLHFQLYGATGGPEKIAAHASEPDVEVLLAPEPSTFFVWCLLGLTFAGWGCMYQYLSHWRKLEAEKLAMAIVPADSYGRPVREPAGESFRPAHGEPHSLELPTWDEGIY